MSDPNDWDWEDDYDPNDVSVLKKTMIDAKNPVLFACLPFIVIRGQTGETLYIDQVDRISGVSPPKFQLGFLRLWLLGHGYRMIRVSVTDPKEIRYKIVHTGENVSPQNLARDLVTENPEILDPPAEKTPPPIPEEVRVFHSPPVCKPSYIAFIPYGKFEVHGNAMDTLVTVLTGAVERKAVDLSDLEVAYMRELLGHLLGVVHDRERGYAALHREMDNPAPTGSAPAAGTRTSASGGDVRTAP